MIKTSCDANSLSLSSRKDVMPWFLSVKSPFVLQLFKLDYLKKLCNVKISFTFVNHIILCVWINDLVSKISCWEICGLRNKRDLTFSWEFDFPTIWFPEFTHYSENRCFTRPIWPIYKAMISLLKAKIYFIYDSLSIRSSNWNMNEL